MPTEIPQPTAIPQTTPDRQWSPQQRAIHHWFGEGDGHLVVRARAGTGKTTTIIEGINHAPEGRILLAAFNKRIQEELATRIQNPAATAQTAHSVGYACVRRFWEHVQVAPGQDRAKSLTQAACGDRAPDAIKRLVGVLCTKGREMAPHATEPGSLVDIAWTFDCVPDDVWDRLGFGLDYVESKALEAMRLAAERKPTEGIDFSDMLFLPVRNRWLVRQYDLCVIDEAQDMTATQLELLRGVCGGRVALVGDDRQCQPPGTMVRVLADHDKPIEWIKAGDWIETFDRHGQAFVSRGIVNEVSQRQYDGELLTIKVGKKESRCTPSHKWLVRWTNRTDRTWVTYLMRLGDRYRIGQCRMFRAAPSAKQDLMFALGQRTRIEQADAAWILRVHHSVTEALAYEQIVAARYGLPEMIFQPAFGIKHFTRDVIDAVFTALRADGLEERADRCLKDHGRDISYPIYVAGNQWERRGRTTLFETQACNLLSGFMALAVAPERIEGHDKINRHAVRWETITAISRAQYGGPVYSLQVNKYHKYVADGLVTCNSIYRFRGADSTSLDRLKAELDAAELGLTVTYRCGQLIAAAAARLVPDLVAHPSSPDGEITALPSIERLLEDVGPNDFVLSRVNAPLVRVAMALVRARKKVRIQGRDIGAGLKALMHTLATGRAKESIPAFIDKVRGWESREVERALRMDREDKAEQVHDKAQTLLNIIDGATGVPEVEARLDALFSDAGNDGCVMCSSVHRAKGLEADRVFILRDTLYPTRPMKAGKKRERTVEEQQEEANIEYVAITRARRVLVWVAGK